MAANGAQATVREPQVPPQNLDAEESALGAMMLSAGAIAAVSEVLSADGREFYRESHAKVYRAALALYAKGEPVDAITLVDQLDERGELEDAGGKVRVHELAALVPASANAGHYAQIVKEAATLRGLIRATSPRRRRPRSSATSRLSSRRVSSGSRSSTSRAPTSPASRLAFATSTGSRPGSRRGT
jgi:hypothetical protein